MDLVTKGHKSHAKGTVHRTSTPESQVGHPVSEVVFENLREAFLKERLAIVCASPGSPSEASWSET